MKGREGLGEREHKLTGMLGRKGIKSEKEHDRNRPEKK